MAILHYQPKALKSRTFALALLIGAPSACGSAPPDGDSTSAAADSTSGDTSLADSAAGAGDTGMSSAETGAAAASDSSVTATTPGDAQADGTTQVSDTAGTDTAATQPGQDNGTTNSDAANPDLALDYYPLVDGAEWVYRHSNGGQLLRVETVRMVASSFNGRDTFFVFDPTRGDFSAGTEGHLVHEAGKVMRIHKVEYADGGAIDFEVDYDPGFARFDAAWLSATGPMSDTYLRTDTNQPDLPEQRIQVHTLLGTEVEVTVPAGTFTTVHVQRDRDTDAPPGAATIKQFWFAPGIGKVKEEHLDGDTAGKIEELQSCSLPACS